MRILQIVPSLDPAMGGPSRSTPALTAALAEAGAEPTLLTTGSAGEDTANGHSFQRSFPSFLCPSTALKKHLASLDADVIHHHALWLRTLHYAAQYSRRTNAPLVISPRGMFSEWAMRHHWLRKKLAAGLVHPGAFRLAAGWHATSPEEADDIRRAGFQQPVCVSPNGIEPIADEQLAEARKEWSARLPGDGRRTALFYSRFHRKKRVIELIELWAALKPKTWRLLLVGIEEEYTLNDLREKIRRAGAGENIFVFAGNESRHTPYPAADLFVFPSHSENFGMVVAEALASGIPVLVTDSTPWAGVNKAECGWRVPWEQFGRQLATILNLPADDLKTRGARGRTWVTERYSWHGAARLLLDFYRSLG